MRTKLRFIWDVISIKDIVIVLCVVGAVACGTNWVINLADGWFAL